MKVDSEAAEKLDRILEEHEDVRSPLIQILHAVQQELGHIPIDAQRYIAEHTGIPQSEIYGVVSFYSFFDMEPQGEHLITVCTGTACYIKGADSLIERMSDEYGIGLGETSEDGKFTLNSARCMGCCSLAPVAVIDGEIHGKLSAGELMDLLSQYE